VDIPYLGPLLRQDRPIWIMGAHDVLSAKIAQRAGFDAIGVQSLQMAFVNGQPDIGVITPDELLAMCRKIRRSIDLPIVVDFEQGFGEPYASVYWMHEFERAGAAAVHIDDYGLPYKCPFIPPHVMALESMEETADKIRAMVGEKLDRRFMVIGRPGTYVARVHRDEESRRADWLRRAQAYQLAGADAIFAICWTVEHARFFRSQVSGPMMTIRTLGTETDQDRVQYASDMMQLSVDELYQLGYQLQIEPTTMLGVAANAMAKAVAREKETGRIMSVFEEHGNLYTLLDLWMNAPEVRRIRETYVRTPFAAREEHSHADTALDNRYQGAGPGA
jgi:2-methylisocitrate lyase-like PEP mutase family enzyme